MPTMTLESLEELGSAVELEARELEEARRRRDEAIVRLARGGTSLRAIGRAAGISHEAVRLIVSRARR